MKPGVVKSLTHVFAAAVGVALVAGFSGVSGDRNESGGKNAAATGGSSASSPPDRADRPENTRNPLEKIHGVQVKRFTARECQAAWEAIGKRNLTKDERCTLQQQVLMRWAEVDPEAALKAALESPWDSQGTQQVLLGSFHQYFSNNPVEAWDLIRSGRLGVGADLVKVSWAYAAGRENPGLVLSYIGEMPPSQITGVMQSLATYVRNDPEKREAFINRLCEFPEDQRFTDWIKRLAPMLSAGETSSSLRDKLAAAETPQRKTLYLHQFGQSLKDADMATIRSEWSQLPQDAKERAARAITLHTDPQGAKNTPGLFTMLAEVSQWDFMNTEKWRLGRYAQTPEKKEELAKWALTLPEHSGSQEIFHRAVEPYIRADMDKAGDWIETLPKGWQRDRALAELSQQAIYRKGHTELSDWALGQISDPKLKADATKWRGDWAKKTGRN